MLCLPALHGVLVLRAVDPGSTELIRAAVDYDGIDDLDQDKFNLTLQRVAHDTGLILDQEIYRKVSCSARSIDNIKDALRSSTLVQA